MKMLVQRVTKPKVDHKRDVLCEKRIGEKYKIYILVSNDNIKNARNISMVVFFDKYLGKNDESEMYEVVVLVA